MRLFVQSFNCGLSAVIGRDERKLLIYKSNQFILHVMVNQILLSILTYPYFDYMLHIDWFSENYK